MWRRSWATLTTETHIRSRVKVEIVKSIYNFDKKKRSYEGGREVYITTTVKYQLNFGVISHETQMCNEVFMISNEFLVRMPVCIFGLK